MMVSLAPEDNARPRVCRYDLMLAVVAVAIAYFITAPTVIAEPPAKVEAAVVPAGGDSGPYADGQVIPAASGETVASRVFKRTSYRPVREQIRFAVQIVSVDKDTRRQIYDRLSPDCVDTKVTPIENISAAGDETDLETDLNSYHRLTTGSIVTTAVLSGSEVIDLLTKVNESSNSRVIASPKVIAAAGQVAGIQQRVQRPFLSRLNEVRTGDDLAVGSEIQVLDEGTDLIVQGDLVNDAVRVRIKFQQSQVTEVKSISVYGIGNGEKQVQVPSHEVKVASATRELLPEHTLLIDPYFQTSEQVPAEVNAVFSAVPYLAEALANARNQTVTNQILILLTAKKL